MKVPTLTTKEINIRLANDNRAFICTIRHGWLFSKTTSFLVQPDPNILAALEHNESRAVRVGNRLRGSARQ
jgi:hypothetical protein